MQMRTRLFFARNLLKTWSALQIMKQQESADMFEAAGNQFITYFDPLEE